ncbi:hypothetical protein [Streptacidiphilus cavernicola]|uniref:HEAT repeat domain-containing protein n=1 Tax=Streptacidiphilus cavernicola TaxID=3342716 RepID=A0ABV6W1F5_9ACTN
MATESHDPRAVIDRLHSELDPLAHPARMRALAAWTQDQLKSPEGRGAARLRTLLDELEARGPHGRRLAVMVAAIGQDTAFLEARLADPDAVVRSQALKSSLRLPVSDAALERAMDDAPQAVRRQLATIVVAGGRTALAERLIRSVRELWGNEEAARLLPGCGPEAVEQLLPGLFLAVVRWQPLGRLHPDLVLDQVARQLADLPEQLRVPWWQRNADVFTATAAGRPLRVLELLERHCPAQLPAPVRACLGELLKAAPGRTIRLLTAPERLAGPPQRGLVSRTALSRLARLGLPELLDLGRAWSASQESLALLLRALPPSQREAFYDAATADKDLSTSSLSDTLLNALPRQRAQAEARRMAAQAAERGAPWETVLAAVAHLPVPEARPDLLAATRRPAPEDRALAYPLLVRNAARSDDPSAITELLEDLRRLRNEQEPVRSPALLALADVPPRLFTGPDADALERIVTDAVEARDNSARTRWALAKLAVGLLREHAVSGERLLVGWALTTLTRLSGHTGGADLGRLDRTLRRGQEAQVFEALRPWLEAAADKVDHRLTFALARALGRRARHLPELQELLWQAIQFGDLTTVRQAVGLWLDEPTTRGERVARVLELEPSAAVLQPVLEVLTQRRTDLLDAVLADTPPYGRFLAAGTRWVPPVDRVGAWLPRQRAAAARLLTRAADDPSRPMHVRAGHIHAAVSIPDLGFQIALRYLDSPDTVLAEAALGALVWTDRPASALPLLLAHAGDDRARVALYAAARATRFVAPSLLAEVLRGALLPAEDGVTPAAKVTSRKELVRLVVSQLPSRTAAEILAEVFALPGQHRDVQAACVPMAVELLRSPTAWALLESAADGLPVVQATVLRTQPQQLQEDDRPRYARLVGKVAASSDRETADAATALLARWSPWYPQARQLLLTAAVDLDNRSSWRAAADGLVALAASTDGAGPLLEALARLVAAEAYAPEHHLDAESERDRPARRRVTHLVTCLSTSVTMRHTQAIRTAALRASELLRTAADFESYGTHLFATALDLDAEPEHLLAALTRLEALHAGRPALAARTAGTLRDRLNAARHPGDPLVLLRAAERLTADAGYTGGLFAVALTGALGSRTNWTPAWRHQLRALRRHPHPDVREAALTLTTAVE